MGSSMDAKDIILKAIRHRTSENPIKSVELVNLCREYGFSLSNERVRDEIRLMRKEGVLILSVSKTGGGYYMSQSMEDYLEFRNHNILPRVTDMQDTMKQMDRAAQREYKSIAQERLF